MQSGLDRFKNRQTGELSLPGLWDSYRNKMRKVEQFDTNRALEFAFAAHRVNGGYVKQNVLDYTQSPDDPHEVIRHTVKVANKTLIYDALTNVDYGNEFGRAPALTVTQEDIEAVERARDHFRSYTFKSLGNGLNDFQNDIYQAVSKETTDRYAMGLLAYIPTMVERELTQKVVKKTIKNEYAESEHIGARGEKFEGDLIVLDKRYVASYDRYVYTTGQNGNLVSFWTGNNDVKIGDKITVTGKIKSHGIAYQRKEKETVLNYIKIIKVECPT